MTVQIDSSEWLKTLSRRGWAWEFLRRSPAYCSDFSQGLGTDADKWGLMRLENPARDARHAGVFWHAEECPSVLPLVAVQDTKFAIPVPFNLDAVACKVDIHHHDGGDRVDILFSEEGRFLQLSIEGAKNLSGTPLMMLALEYPGHVTARAASFRRLNDLMQHGHLRQSLYPRDPRAPRLMKVLTALDGALAGLAHREIALQIFNRQRVEAEWGGRQQNLRDQVRRAIAYGQGLMGGGYKQFLRPTYSRQIARPGVLRAQGRATGLS
jgi:hypothetical protein